MQCSWQLKDIACIQHFRNNQWHWGGPGVMFQIFNHQLQLGPRGLRLCQGLTLQLLDRGAQRREARAMKDYCSEPQTQGLWAAATNHLNGSLSAFSSRYGYASEYWTSFNPREVHTSNRYSLWRKKMAYSLFSMVKHIVRSRQYDEFLHWQGRLAFLYFPYKSSVREKYKPPTTCFLIRIKK